MKKIQAEITALSVVSLKISHAVRVIGPVPMQPKDYDIDQLRILARASSREEEKQMFWRVLAEQVIEDYNKHVDAAPIMDMFEDAAMYENLYHVNWIENRFPDAGKCW